MYIYRARGIHFVKLSKCDPLSLSAHTEQCIPYTGDFCHSVGYSQNTTVFFRMNVRDSIADMELELRGSLHALQDELTPGCEMVIMQLLCYGALPICSDDGEWCGYQGCEYVNTALHSVAPFSYDFSFPSWLSLPPPPSPSPPGKQSLCEQHCHLLDLLELCPAKLEKMIESIGYLNLNLNLTACEDGHRPLPSPGAPHCLPDPILLNSTGEEDHSECEC